MGKLMVILSAILLAWIGMSVLSLGEWAFHGDMTAKSAASLISGNQYTGEGMSFVFISLLVIEIYAFFILLYFVQDLGKTLWATMGVIAVAYMVGAATFGVELIGFYVDTVRSFYGNGFSWSVVCLSVLQGAFLTPPVYPKAYVVIDGWLEQPEINDMAKRELDHAMGRTA